MLLCTRDHMLDGFCPLTAIDEFAVDETVGELVRQALLARVERDGREGVVIINYAKHNETKAQIERRLELDRVREDPSGAGRSGATRIRFRLESVRIPIVSRPERRRIPAEFHRQSQSQSQRLKSRRRTLRRPGCPRNCDRGSTSGSSRRLVRPDASRAS